MIVTIENQIFEIKFGLMSLMVLKQLSKEEGEDKLFEKIFYLLTHGQIPYDVARSLVQIKDIILQAFNEAFSVGVIEPVQSCADMLDRIQDIEQEVKVLFMRGVGEAGLPPQAFYAMTPAEIDLAYKGYIKKLERQTNLMAIANSGEAPRIKLLGGEGYTLSSLEEREQTLKELGL